MLSRSSRFCAEYSRLNGVRVQSRGAADLFRGGFVWL